MGNEKQEKMRRLTSLVLPPVRSSRPLVLSISGVIRPTIPVCSIRTTSLVFEEEKEEEEVKAKIPPPPRRVRTRPKDNPFYHRKKQKERLMREFQEFCKDYQKDGDEKQAEQARIDGERYKQRKALWHLRKKMLRREKREYWGEIRHQIAMKNARRTQLLKEMDERKELILKEARKEWLTTLAQDSCLWLTHPEEIRNFKYNTPFDIEWLQRDN